MRLGLTELSSLKLQAGLRGHGLDPQDQHARAERPGHPGDSLFVVGRPSFTRLRRISFGLINRAATVRDSGQLWFDEMRAIDVAKDRGHGAAGQRRRQALQPALVPHVVGRPRRRLPHRRRDAGQRQHHEQPGVRHQPRPPPLLRGHRHRLAGGVLVQPGHLAPALQRRRRHRQDRGGGRGAASRSTIPARGRRSYSRNWSERSNPLPALYPRRRHRRRELLQLGQPQSQQRRLPPPDRRPRQLPDRPTRAESRSPCR